MGGAEATALLHPSENTSQLLKTLPRVVMTLTKGTASIHGPMTLNVIQNNESNRDAAPGDLLYLTDTQALFIPLDASSIPQVGSYVKLGTIKDGLQQLAAIDQEAVLANGDFELELLEITGT